MDRTPNLFLVGVQRSATTALWTYLGEHREVFMGPKEVHFFGRDLGVFGEAVNHGARPSLEQYLEYFEPATTERYRGDASVGYLYSHTAAAEIHEFSPDARIIASFRNPVDMVYSLYSLLRFQGAEPCTSLADALADEGTPRWAFTSWPFRWAFTYRDVLRYAEQLGRFIEAFGRDKVHVVIYEDFVADPGATYREVLEFLEVDPGYRPDFRVVNANRKLRSKLLHQWLHRPPALLRRGGKLMLPVRPARRLLGKQLIAHNKRDVTRSELDPGVRRMLEIDLSSEVAQLGEILDRDLGGVWGRTDSLAPS